MDEIQQESVQNKFINSRANPDDFFLKTYHPESGDKALQEAIYRYVEKRMAEILSLLIGKIMDVDDFL